MSLAAGVRLGPYEIHSAIGAGGMGEVWKARDTTLGRDVALKILPDHLALDPDRLARFKREAQILASLNHPNIATIHGFQESDGVQALVLELVEGPTLADRIAQGPIPIDEALPIARQIAEALEAAHEQGIVHRDLKPANIKLRPDGTVKVLDFGLAKAIEPATAGPPWGLSMSPTITSPAATHIGVILGTAAYMSPEQARGKPVDKRADVWAFGCVLYEMLAATRAFSGDEISDTLAFIITKDPDWAALPATSPPAVTRLLRRCLEKEPRERLRDMGDARIEIREAQSGRLLDDGYRPSAPPRRTERLAWMLALTVVTLIATALGIWVLYPPPVIPEVRLEVTTPPTESPTSFAVSPDGQQIVFAGTAEGKAQLWVRPLDGVSARPLAGTDGATRPFWSPDSLSIGFFADGQLKRIDLDGGTVRVLASAENGFGGTWSPDGTVLFNRRNAHPISRVPALGGHTSELTRLKQPEEAGHRGPEFLPDRRHVLYHVNGTPEVRGVYVTDLEGASPRRLLEADSSARYSPTGQLLYVRQGTLFAHDFDLTRLALVGNPYPVAADVAVENGYPAVSVSATGVIVYRSGVSGRRSQFEWFDRSGNRVDSVSDPDNDALNPSMSPDGRQVAVQRAGTGNVDIWVLDLGRGTFRRLTFDSGLDILPIWSPDASRVVFSSNRSGHFDLYSKPANGADAEELLLVTPEGGVPQDWSPDGRVLLYRSRQANGGLDLWALPLEGDRKPYPVTQTNFSEKDGQFSPDGKWIAYQSDESGRSEIYIRPFAGSGAKTQVSTTGGAQVRWRRDGRELFYIGLDNRLMAVQIRLDTAAMMVDVGAPVALFATRVGPAVLGVDSQQYMVTADGQRFLMNGVVEEAPSPLTVILNWKPKP